MRFRSFFDVIGDAKDVVEFFDGVDSVEQMVSKLERIKRRDTEEFLVCVQSLKLSIDAAMDDTFEMGSSVEVNEDEPDLTEEEIDDLDKEEEEKPAEEPPAVAKG